MKGWTMLAAAGAAAVVVIVAGAGIGLAAGMGDDDEPLTGSTYDKAVAAALAETGGTVTETEVGDDGAVYSVEVRLDDGSQREINLDAEFNVIGSEVDDDGPGDDVGPDDD
jgi:hypothetical protein